MPPIRICDLLRLSTEIARLLMIASKIGCSADQGDDACGMAVELIDRGLHEHRRIARINDRPTTKLWVIRIAGHHKKHAPPMQNGLPALPGNPAFAGSRIHGKEKRTDGRACLERSNAWRILSMPGTHAMDGRSIRGSVGPCSRAATQNPITIDHRACTPSIQRDSPSWQTDFSHRRYPTTPNSNYPVFGGWPAAADWFAIR